MKTIKILKGLHRNGIYLLEFSSDDRFLISISLNNYDDTFNINNINELNKKNSNFNFNNEFNTENLNNILNIKSNVIIYEWQTGRVLFSYIINSALIDLNYFDFTYDKLEILEEESEHFSDALRFGNEFYKFYQDNLTNVFALALKKNIYFLILKKNSIEIKDLKLEGMVTNEITSCKIYNKNRFIDENETRKGKKDKDKDKDKKNFTKGFKNELNFFIFTGHNDGSLIKWELDLDGINKSINYYFLLFNSYFLFFIFYSLFFI